MNLYLSIILLAISLLAFVLKYTKGVTLITLLISTFYLIYSYITLQEKYDVTINSAPYYVHFLSNNTIPIILLVLAILLSIFHLLKRVD